MQFSKIGPAFLVTAAFIGPGTVITTSLAGANFGMSLVWALVFSTIATIILQEMSARLGIVTQKGLGENIRLALSNPILKTLGMTLIVGAIVIGNAAYQGGNISGASLGMAGLFEGIITTDFPLFPLLIGAIAFGLLWSGKYQLIEGALIALVGLMSLAFLLTFIISAPSLSELFSNLFIPTIPDGATLTVVALIGTTVVPYNLFLHTSTAKLKWQSTKQIPEARRDLTFSISLGGLISIAILSTAASAFFGKAISIQSANDIAPALKPILGDWAPIFMGFGLFAAGISSAITAPLAAAFALTDALNLDGKLSSKPFKSIWLIILVLGVTVAASGYKPISIILFAQVANGVLLPLVTLFLLWMMNTKALGKYQNNWWQNTLGFIVLLITLLLSGRSLMSAFGLL